jgi:hypothetical protein
MPTHLSHQAEWEAIDSWRILDRPSFIVARNLILGGNEKIDLAAENSQWPDALVGLLLWSVSFTLKDDVHDREK